MAKFGLGVKYFAPPPGKFPPGRMNAVLEWSFNGWAICAIGRAGQSPGPPGVSMHVKPVTGVQGKPECAVIIPLISQPPSALLVKSLRPRKMGSSHSPDQLK